MVKNVPFRPFTCTRLLSSLINFIRLKPCGSAQVYWQHFPCSGGDFWLPCTLTSHWPTRPQMIGGPFSFYNYESLMAVLLWLFGELDRALPNRYLLCV